MCVKSVQTGAQVEYLRNGKQYFETYSNANQTSEYLNMYNQDLEKSNHYMISLLPVAILPPKMTYDL